MGTQQPGVLAFTVPATPRRFGWLFWTLCTLSIGLTLFLTRELIGEIRAKSWPQVPCSILRSRLAYTSSNPRQAMPDILYFYEFQGESYQSSQICPSASARPAGWTASSQLLAMYATGSSNTCYVNPKSPKEAVLKAEPAYLLPVLGMTPLLIWLLAERGLLCGLGGRRQVALQKMATQSQIRGG